MNIAPLIEKLIEIERALGTCDTITVRNLIVDAQDCALMLQKEAIQFHGAQEQFQLSEES
jgi:hypothetical protein